MNTIPQPNMEINRECHNLSIKAVERNLVETLMRNLLEFPFIIDSLVSVRVAPPFSTEKVSGFVSLFNKNRHF